MRLSMLAIITTLIAGCKDYEKTAGSDSFVEDASCWNECEKEGSIICLEGLSYRKCQKGIDGCLKEIEKSCKSGGQCKTVSCEDGTGCVYVKLYGPCDDNDQCTTNDECIGGGCRGVWGKDSDGDGYFDMKCGGDDCNDDDQFMHPGAIEICGSGEDEDCDWAIDENEEDLFDCEFFYRDGDGDGLGDQKDFKCLCAQKDFYTANEGIDCDDADPLIGDAPACAGMCPDWKLQVGEICDDGNMFPFDGCNKCTGEDAYINSPMFSINERPVVAELAGDRFILVWQSSNNDKNDKNLYDLRALVIDKDLKKLGEEFFIAGVRQGFQGYPVVAGLSSGGFVILWESVEKETDFEIIGSVFDANLKEAGEEFKVNNYSAGRQLHPAVGAFKNGGFVAAWISYNQVSAGYEVMMRLFEENGEPVKNEQIVNYATKGHQQKPSVAVSDDGIFSVVYVTKDGEESLWYRLFDEGGAPLIEEKEIPLKEGSSQVIPDLAFNKDGNLFVIWSYHRDYEFGIRGAAIDPYKDSAGIAKTIEFSDEIKKYVTNLWFVRFPKAAALSDGGVAVAYSEYNDLRDLAFLDADFNLLKL